MDTQEGEEEGKREESWMLEGREGRLENEILGEGVKACWDWPDKAC